MIGADVKYSGTDCTVGIALGELRHVTPHTGFDREPTVDITFAHGRISMPSAMMRELSFRAHEALVSQGLSHRRAGA